MNTKHLKLLAASAAALLLAACGGSDDIVPGSSSSPSSTRQQAGEEVKVTPLLPKKEFRCTWMATAWGLDWPNGRYDESRQKAYYERYLDTLKANHFNAVFFQVRPMADAYYDSPYEPWSQWITGRRGRNPGYDVLNFLITEAHKRGISFHAYMNPYRIATRASKTTAFRTLESTIPDSLVKDYNTIRIYNPALPATRERIAAIVGDLLQKYDVDGIHFDDYFYPSLQSGESMGDVSEFRKYGKGFNLISDWRRANVDSMIIKVQQTIRRYKPTALFSVSPQGNYDNNYNTMYCDIEKWSQNGWCDVIIPQLYWSTARYFKPRFDWFAEHAAVDTKLMVGYGISGFSSSASDQLLRTNDDLRAQMQYADANARNAGHVFYSARYLLSNPVNIMAVIKEQFPTLVLEPYLGHQPEVKPSVPGNFKANGLTLTWSPVPDCYYAVYRSNGDGVEATLVDITYDTTCTVAENGNYFVTAVTKGVNAQSDFSEIVNADRDNTGIHHIRM